MIEIKCDTLTAEIGEELETEDLLLSTDSIHYHRFSVWRIAQSMPNATPQQLDSAIQANLPERETFRSERPDTLEIPGLHAKSPFPVLDDLPVCYKMGFFQHNKLLHPEVELHQSGYSGIPLPYQLWRDDWITSLVLMCFFMLVFIGNKIKSRFIPQFKDFFFPLRNKSVVDDGEVTIERHADVILMLIMSMMGSLAFFIYTQSRMNFSMGQISPYMLIGLYIGLWIAYFIFKTLLSQFVNWIFFDKTSRKSWRKSNSFLISVESMLLFPVAIITVYFNLSLVISCWIILLIGIITKSLLFYKTYQIFFGKFYGILHLFVYFCTLEMMPLLVTLKVLTLVTDELIVKI